ncbi:MAG: heavy-metal-associated domain-containing protein [Bacteroidales bacterium]|nr:heavy-metal-associated domain-containing protein [Bacteroidales bacterium]
MKQVIKITLIAVIAMFIGVNAYASQDEKKKANVEEVTFVTNIDCKNCVKKVEAKLPYEKGVKDLKVNLEEKTIYFKFDNKKTTKENLQKAIEKLGYAAEEKK